METASVSWPQSRYVGPGVLLCLWRANASQNDGHSEPGDEMTYSTFKLRSASSMASPPSWIFFKGLSSRLPGGITRGYRSESQLHRPNRASQLQDNAEGSVC